MYVHMYVWRMYVCIYSEGAHYKPTEEGRYSVRPLVGWFMFFTASAVKGRKLLQFCKGSFN